jgi:hypothetical protein
MEVDYVRVYQESALSNSEEVKLNDIKVYPNPVTDNLIIETNNNLLGINAKIYSILGQEINSVFLNEQQNNIDVSKVQVVPDPAMFIFPETFNHEIFNNDCLKIGLNWATDRPLQRFGEQDWKKKLSVI